MGPNGIEQAQQIVHNRVRIPVAVAYRGAVRTVFRTRPLGREQSVVDNDGAAPSTNKSRTDPVDQGTNVDLVWTGCPVRRL
jgi:hypothetical protein